MPFESLPVIRNRLRKQRPAGGRQKLMVCCGMFWWKKKKQQTEQNQDPVASGWDPRGSIQPLTVMHVVDSFLTQNPAPTPYSVHALIKAGATELMTAEELLQACDKIQEHGYQYPLNPTLRRELHESELLSFLRWQAHADDALEAYQNENTLLELIERYRHDTVL
jgi:hypothetical protein